MTTVRTQAELDKALAHETSTVYIEAPEAVWLYLPVAGTGSSHVEARGSSHVEASGSSHVEAWDSSHVEAWGSSHVVAWDSSHVEAWGSSHVEARGSSHVVAWDSSHVVAWDSSHVVAWDSSHVEASGSSHVEAWDSSHVEARGSSQVVAWDSSHVEAWDSSHVEARGSSHVEASKWVGIHLHSQRVTLDGDGQVIDLTAIDFNDPAEWCRFHGVTVEDGIAYLFKAVNQQWTTGRGVDYSPGSTPEALDWEASSDGCGKGLHFCDHPLRSLDFLGGRAEDARFLRCGVRLNEIVTLGDKVKARRVTVGCVEVDRYGREIAVAVSHG